MKDAVGPVLRMCDQVEFVIRAIEEDNPADSLEIVDCGAYVRVQRSGFLKLTRESLERHLGAGFTISQLESIMSAFAGRIQLRLVRSCGTLRVPARPPGRTRYERLPGSKSCPTPDLERLR
jgi:toluene monooxygenase system protein D